MKVALLAAAIVLAGGPAIAAPYDDSWYRAPFWSGEYPDGFSVVKATTLQLRPTLDKDADKTIACDLPQGATYQPWNQSRVEEQGLTFVSFTKIGDYKMLKPLETTLYRRMDATELQVKLSKGETWRYLVYLGEGAFLMEYKGEEFDGNPDMLDASEQQGVSLVPVDRAYATWSFVAAGLYAPCRLYAQYDLHRNGLGRAPDGTPTTLRDDVFTVRTEVAF